MLALWPLALAARNSLPPAVSIAGSLRSAAGAGAAKAGVGVRLPPLKDDTIVRAVLPPGTKLAASPAAFRSSFLWKK